MTITVGNGITVGAGVTISSELIPVSAGLQLYLDAGNPASYPGSGSTWTDLGAGIRLMRRWDAAQYWGGRLGIVRIYDAALTAEQVTQNYDADRSRFGL